MLHQKQVDAFCSKIVELLQQTRIKKGLSMNAVAERGGLSQQMVSYVERGMRRPTLDTIVRMAYALETDLSAVIHQAQRDFRPKAKQPR